MDKYKVVFYQPPSITPHHHNFVVTSYNNLIMFIVQFDQYHDDDDDFSIHLISHMYTGDIQRVTDYRMHEIILCIQE